MKKIISALMLGTICLSGCSGNKPFRYGNVYTKTIDNYTCNVVCREENSAWEKQNYGESVVTYRITTVDEFNEVKMIEEVSRNYFYKDGAFMRGNREICLVNGYDKSGKEFIMFTYSIGTTIPVVFYGTKIYAK